MDKSRLGSDDRFIFIPEIVDLICEEVYSVRHGLKTLSRLARTCRFFHESALDYLWKEITGIHILIKCMPQDLWNDTLLGQERTMQLTRAIIPSDWTRLMIYAHRIKSFRTSDSLLYTSESILQMYRALDVLPETSILLQNIKKLHWKHPRDDMFPYIRFFLGPKLSDLTMALNSNSNNQLSFLYTLPSRHLHLRNFCMRKTGNQDAMDAVSGAICGWSYLRCLSVPKMKGSTLMHLMRFTSLKDLTMETYEEGPTPFSIPHGCLCFSSLERFMLGACADLKDVTALVGMMSNPPLTTFSISTIYSSTAMEWRRLFSALRNQCNHSSLKGIIIQGMALLNVEGMMMFDVLKPLLVFTNLTNVTLNPPNGFNFEVQDIEEIAMAWPRVIYLDLRPISIPQDRSRSSLHSLIPIAKYCTQIFRLSIMVDATNIAPVSMRRMGQGIRNDSLMFLDVRGSPIRSAIEVAAFLSDIFPEIDCISSTSRGVERTEERVRLARIWREVEGLIPVLSSIRKQEHDEDY